MSRLPTREDLGALPSARTGRGIAQIRASVADTSSVGRAAANFGDAITKAGANISAASEQADEFETERRFQEFKWNQTQDLDKTMREVQPGQAGKLPDTWTSSYSERAREFFGTVPDSLKPQYDAKLFGAERELYGSAATFARTEQKRYSIQSLDEHKNRLATTGDIDKAKQDYDSLLQTNPYLTPIEKDEVRKKGLGDLEEGYVKWRLERGDDIDDLIKELESPPAPETKTGPQSNAIEHHKDGMATVRTGSGAGFRVSGDYADRFAGALADLEAAGVEIDQAQSGGYANRNIRGTNTRSQHSFGRAIDVNWTDNARGTKGKIDPELARSVAEKWGLKWGGDWKNPDPMHFEVDRDAEPTAVAEAPPVAERGLTQYAGLESKDTATDAGTAALPGEVVASRYEYLPAEKRAALLKAAKAARDTKQQERLWDFKQQIEDDVASVRKTGQGRDGLELDAIQKTVDPSVWNNYVNSRREAEMEYNSGVGVEEMDDGQLTSHLESLVPEAGSADYEMKAKVYGKVKSRADDIRKLRTEDPAASVDQLPEVQRVAKRLQETGVQDQGAIVKARLDAQERIGIPEQDRLPITKAEAKALLDLPAQRWNVNEKDYILKLRAAVDRAEETYGPLMARRVFESAVGLDLKDKTGTDAAAGIMSKMARGEAATADDFRRMSALQDIDQVSRTFDATLRPDMGETGDRPAISPNFGRDNIDFTTRYAAEQAGKNPNAGQEQWIRDNPDQIGLFDAKFGRGAAARALAKSEKGAKPKK